MYMIAAGFAHIQSILAAHVCHTTLVLLRPTDLQRIIWVSNKQHVCMRAQVGCIPALLSFKSFRSKIGTMLLGVVFVKKCFADLQGGFGWQLLLLVLYSLFSCRRQGLIWRLLYAARLICQRSWLEASRSLRYDILTHCCLHNP